jgi:hypothetical protein
MRKELEDALASGMPVLSRSFLLPSRSLLSLDTLALASAQTGKSMAEERLKLMDSELQGHVARADKALNLAKDQLLKARDEASELAAARADSQAAHSRAEKAHAAQLLSLEDARKKEIGRYEQKIVALQAETEHEKERNAKLNSLYTISLQRPEELQGRCSLLQMQVSVKRDLLQCQKRPTTVSKETYYSVKRDLL